MSCESWLKIIGLLGLYEDSPAGDNNLFRCCGRTGAIIGSLFVKILFLVVDFVSTSLDWQVAFRVAQGDFRLIHSGNTEEETTVVVQSITAAYTIVLVLSHIIFLRGKWFYLNDGAGDWAAFSMTELVIYSVEDVATVYLFFVTQGFFDPEGFIDRLNLILSNVSGYLVVIVLWVRLILGDPAPCSAYILPIMVTIEIILISFVSYRTLFMATYYESEEGEYITIFDFLIPWIAGGWATVIFIWILVLLCRWPKCMHWADRRGGTQDDHNHFGFAGLWTLVFGASIACGWALSNQEGRATLDWIQSYSEIRGELPTGLSDIDSENLTISDGAVLRFGHIVEWGRNGDKNGRGSTILIGAKLLNSSHNNSDFMVLHGSKGSYSCFASLCSPAPCIGDWSIDRVVPNVPYCSYPTAFGGFYTNSSGTYGFLRRPVYYKDDIRYGERVLRDNNISNEALTSIASGGTAYFDVTPGADVTPNPSRVVVGFAYPTNRNNIMTNSTYPTTSNSRGRSCRDPKENHHYGVIKVFQLYQQRYRDLSGRFNTAHAMHQLGQNSITVPTKNDDDKNYTSTSIILGEQISMGKLNSSRFVTTSTTTSAFCNPDQSAIIITSLHTYEYNSQHDHWTLATGVLNIPSTSDSISFELSDSGNRLIVGSATKSQVYVYESGESEYGIGISWSQIGPTLTPAYLLESHHDQKDAEAKEQSNISSRDNDYTCARYNKYHHFGYAVTINQQGTRVAVASECVNGTGNGTTTISSVVAVWKLVSQSDTFSWKLLGSLIEGGEDGNFMAKYRDSLSMNADGSFLAIGGVGRKGEESEGVGRVRVFKLSKLID